MDIDLLSKMVKELILDDDRVILPGLGCFVAEVVPATFSDKGYTINPPYRRLYFRARPDDGDVLVSFYAKSNNIEYDLAEKIIKDFLAELKSILHQKKIVVFPGLGRLRATKENNLFFVADEDLDIYPAGFGLEAISLKTHQESRAEVSAAVADLKNILVAEPVTAVEEPMAVVGEEPAAEPAIVVIEEPAAEPIIEPVVESIQDPVEEVKVEADLEPVAAPEPEPVAAPELAVVTEPVAEFEPVVELEPSIEPEPVAEPELAVVPEQVATVEPDAVAPVVTVKTSMNPVLKTLLVILAVFVVLVVAYMAVGRLCPEILDNILYSPEELEILNR